MKKSSTHYDSWRHKDLFLLFSALTTTVLGLLALLDLHLGTELVRFSESFAPLHYNSALGLFIVGLGLVAYISKQVRITALIGLVLISFGFSSVFQIILSTEYGFEKIFFMGGLVKGSIGSRLSFNTSISFLLIGVGFLFQEIKWKYSTTAVFISSGAVFGTSSVALLGILTSLPLCYQWFGTAPMTPVTGVAFFFAGLSGMLIAIYKHFENKQDFTLWIPVNVALIFSYVLFIFVFNLFENEKARAKLAVNQRIHSIQRELEDRIKYQIQAIEKSAISWPENIEKIKNEVPSLISIKKVPPHSIQKENRQSIRFVPNTSQGLSISALVFESPLYNETRLEGFIQGTFNTQSLIEIALEEINTGEISFEILISEKTVFKQTRKEPLYAYSKDIAFEIFGTDWNITGTPLKTFYNNQKSNIPMVVLFLGLVFSSLISILTYFALVAIEKAKLLESSQSTIMQAKEEALLASRLKSEFLANMSHEIRTPINALMGVTELLTDSKLTVEQKKNVHAIRFSAESLLEILNEVLDLAKIEAGKMEIENIDFDFKQLSYDCLKLFETSAKKKKIKLLFEYSDTTLSVFRGDPTRLKQIITNFISNAIKFTENGTILLKISHFDEGERGCKIRLEVTDTGMGIPTHKKEKIFETFSQADSSMSRRFGGTGLGLSICKKLIELMQGEIGFESEEGKGSTFYFIIPLEFGHLVVNQQVKRKPTDHGLRILVAEDNAISRRILTKLLQKQGHIVDAVNDGTEVLKAFEHVRYDVIIMDCQMPNLDGYEATRMIRLAESIEPSKGKTPIIALTAHALVSDRKRCMEVGMDEYLSKPYKAKDLYLAIENISSEIPSQFPSRENPKVKSVRIDISVLDSVIDLHDTNGLRFLKEMVGIFQKTCPKNLKSIKAALLKRDLKKVAEIAHSLKSSSSNLGAMEIFNIAGQLEKSALSRSLKGVRKQVLALEAEIKISLPELKEALSRYENRDLEIAS